MAKEKTPKARRETARAKEAYEMFRDMGAKRSLEDLLLIFVELNDPPTTKYGTLCTWSSWFNWSDRAKKWDDEQAILNQKKDEEERRAEHIERLQTFRRAADNASLNAIASGSTALSAGGAILQKTFEKVSERLKRRLSVDDFIFDDATLEEVLKLMTILEKAQKLSQGGLSMKAEVEGFDKIARYIEAQQK